MRAIQRQIRDTQRQLAPLTVGLVATVKKERSIRLRALVRRRHWASCVIQKIMRGCLVRIAETSVNPEHLFSLAYYPPPLTYCLSSLINSLPLSPIAYPLSHLCLPSLSPNVSYNIYQVRMAGNDPHRFHWIECLDEEQSLKPYYYNTVTQVNHTFIRTTSTF